MRLLSKLLFTGLVLASTSLAFADPVESYRDEVTIGGDPDTRKVTILHPGSNFELLASAGSTQSDASQLTKHLTLATGASGTQGVKLPTKETIGSKEGVFFIISNGGSGALQLYPNTGDSINANSPNVAVPIAGAELAICFSRLNGSVVSWRCGATDGL